MEDQRRWNEDVNIYFQKFHNQYIHFNRQNHYKHTFNHHDAKNIQNIYMYAWIPEDF